MLKKNDPTYEKKSIMILFTNNIPKNQYNEKKSFVNSSIFFIDLCPITENIGFCDKSSAIS